MDIVFSSRFKKEHKKLSESKKKLFSERLMLFKKYPRNPLLNMYKLKGDKKGLVSINITGDYRAIFSKRGKVMTFCSIGNHNNIYK